MVLAILDKTAPSVFAALDVTLRRLGGAPTYVLTENVPRNIFGLLWPAPLCGRGSTTPVAAVVDGPAGSFSAT